MFCMPSLPCFHKITKKKYNIKSMTKRVSNFFQYDINEKDQFPDILTIIPKEIEDER